MRIYTHTLDKFFGGRWNGIELEQLPNGVQGHSNHFDDVTFGGGDVFDLDDGEVGEVDDVREEFEANEKQLNWKHLVGWGRQLQDPLPSIW